MKQKKAHDRIAKLVGPRGRVIAHTGAWSSVAKACGAANLFLSIPFVLHALGPVQFGAWATLVSFVALVGFLDFGFGNGTMNLIAAALGRNALREVPIILNEAMRALFKITAFVAMAAMIVLFTVPWHRVLGLPPEQYKISLASAAAVLTAIVLAIPLNLAARVQLGLGRGARAFKWQSAGQLLTLAAIVTSTYLGASLPALTAISICTPLVASLGNTIDVSRTHLLNQGVVRNLEIRRSIQREGSLFFVLQMAGTVALASDLPLISALLGAREAGTYAIVQRMFSIIPMALSLLWVPLWPIYRQALAARDHQWIFKTLRNTISAAVIGATVGVALLTLNFDNILQLWIHHPIVVSNLLVAGFAAWCVSDALGAGIATFLNAASMMRYQVAIGSLFAVACLVGKSWAIASFGITPVPWVTFIANAVTCLVPTLLLRRQLLSQAIAKTG